MRQQHVAAQVAGIVTGCGSFYMQCMQYHPIPERKLLQPPRERCSPQSQRWQSLCCVSSAMPIPAAACKGKEKWQAASSQTRGGAALATARHPHGQGEPRPAAGGTSNSVITSFHDQRTVIYSNIPLSALPPACAPVLSRCQGRLARGPCALVVGHAPRIREWNNTTSMINQAPGLRDAGAYSGLPTTASPSSVFHFPSLRVLVRVRMPAFVSAGNRRVAPITTANAGKDVFWNFTFENASCSFVRVHQVHCSFGDFIRHHVGPGKSVQWALSSAGRFPKFSMPLDM